MFHIEGEKKKKEKKGRFVLCVLTRDGGGSRKEEEKGLICSLLIWVTAVEHMWTQCTRVAGAAARPRCVQDHRIMK